MRMHDWMAMRAGARRWSDLACIATAERAHISSCSRSASTKFNYMLRKVPPGVIQDAATAHDGAVLACLSLHGTYAQESSGHQEERVPIDQQNEAQRTDSVHRQAFVGT